MHISENRFFFPFIECTTLRDVNFQLLIKFVELQTEKCNQNLVWPSETKADFAILTSHRQENSDWVYLMSKGYNLVKNEKITVFHWYGRGLKSIKMIKHDFLEIGKDCKYGKDKILNLKCKLFIWNTLFWFLLKG